MLTKVVLEVCGIIAYKQPITRTEIENYLKENGIFTIKHYPIPMHLQPAYSELNINKGMLPIAEEISETVLSLPMYYGMTNEQIQYVIDTINNFN